MATEPSTAATAEVAAVPNPKRVAAGQRNRAVRGPLTEAGRERLRAAAHLHRPWEHSTGPKTEAGKQQAVDNGKLRQRGEFSQRQLRNLYTELCRDLYEIRERRRQITCEQQKSRRKQRRCAKAIADSSDNPSVTDNQARESNF